ncbi:hypothetical protein CSC18_4852 [Klebsiella aerogenes]|nr:hypothetical protein CSC18_4852 [Klebsiella aerogenes]
MVWCYYLQGLLGCFWRVFFPNIINSGETFFWLERSLRWLALQSLLLW